MALIDYDELVSTVRELIEGTGRNVTFCKISAESEDSTKPWKSTGSAVTITAHATFVPVSGAQDLGLTISVTDLAKRISQVCLVAPHETHDLQTFNTIIDNGTKWRIEWISALKPGDTVLLIAMGIAQ